jgi:hypothetical protein
VDGSEFAGSKITFDFLEECKRSNKTGKVALIEEGKEGEHCGASRWTMAYLRLDKGNNFDADWVKDMDLVSSGLADLKYCEKMGEEVPIMANSLLDQRVKPNYHGQSRIHLSLPTDSPCCNPETIPCQVVHAEADLK